MYIPRDDTSKKVTVRILWVSSNKIAIGIQRADSIGLSVHKYSLRIWTVFNVLMHANHSCIYYT